MASSPRRTSVDRAFVSMQWLGGNWIAFSIDASVAERAVQGGDRQANLPRGDTILAARAYTRGEGCIPAPTVALGRVNIRE